MRVIPGAISLLTALALTAPANADKATLKVAAFTPPFSLAVTKVIQPWIKAVQADAGDDLEIKTFWGGALGRSPTKQLKLMLDGVADVVLFSTDYTRGRFPEATIFGLPYLVSGGEESSVVMWRMYDRKQLSGFEGIHPIALYGTGLVNFHARGKVTSLADLKGKKIRAAGPGMVNVVKLLGGAPVFMPSPKLAEGLSRGNIDVAMITLGGYTTFRLAKVTTHHLRANLGVTPLGIIMSQKAYNKLSPKLRKIVDRHGGEGLSREAGIEMGRWDATAKTDILKAGHTLIEPSPAQAKAWAKKFQPLHTKWKSTTKNGDQIYANVQKLIAEFRAGK